MNKELIINAMAASFKEANIKLAVKNGMPEDKARQAIEPMSDSILKCMDSVLETLLESFPEFIK